MKTRNWQGAMILIVGVVLFVSVPLLADPPMPGTALVFLLFGLWISYVALTDQNL